MVYAMDIPLGCLPKTTPGEFLAIRVPFAKEGEGGFGWKHGGFG
jgi:hypothetical protein